MFTPFAFHSFLMLEKSNTDFLKNNLVLNNQTKTITISFW